MSTTVLPAAAAAPAAPHRVAAEKRLRGMAIGAAVLLLAVAWAAVGAFLWFKWDDALRAEERQNTNLARALEEQTVRVLATTDQATMRVRDTVAAGGMPDLVRYANETGLAPGILVQLSLIDANGRFVGSNIDPDGSKTGPVDLSSREHVRAHISPATLPAVDRLAQPDALFIGKPVLGKVSKRWTIQTSRRIASRDGSLVGVVVASLDPAYFEDVYRRVQLGSGGGVTLIGSDRNIRARVIGARSSGMGSAVAADGVFARLATGHEGSFRGASSIDGVERIFSYRQVADYPMYLLVSTATHEALAGWVSARNVTLVLTLLLSATVAGGTLAFLLSLRRLEETNVALRRSEAAAQSANQAKSEFLAAISHELRTPLTSIRGFAELMEHRLDHPRFREQAGLIRKGAEYLNDLLSQILDLAKVEAGRMTLASEAVDPRALVRGTIDFFALAAADKGLPLGLTVDDAVPATITVDPLRMKQILNNLLSNAIKFTDHGEVRLALEMRERELRVHVSDTGPGIAEGMQDVIFEKFRQGDARVSYQHGGTGLGLALSRALAELMGGRLSVTSRPGEGARFTLTLPQA